MTALMLVVLLVGMAGTLVLWCLMAEPQKREAPPAPQRASQASTPRLDRTGMGYTVNTAP